MAPKKFKHIVVMIDGTYSSAAQGRFRDTTNMFRLNHAINTEDRHGNPQITFYIPGPGTRGAADRLPGGLFGAGMDEIVKEAYVNIASNYNEADDEQQADRIYLFGFSRGAVLAQALSYLIGRCGLLYGRSIDRFWRVWSHLLDSARNPHLPQEISEFANDDIKIEMLGVFDAVLGRHYSQQNFMTRLKFDHYKLDPVVKCGVHILAADDSRWMFSPLPWEGIDSAPEVPAAQIEQIWVPGVHGDIGGTFSRGDDVGGFLSNVALLTMFEQVQRHTDLMIDDEYIDEIWQDTKQLKRIEISNERRMYMPRAAHVNRQTCRERLGDGVHVGEKIHPVYDLLHGEKIWIRGRKRRYFNPGIDAHKYSLPRYETAWENAYREACKELVNKMR